MADRSFSCYRKVTRVTKISSLLTLYSCHLSSNNSYLVHHFHRGRCARWVRYSHCITPGRLEWSWTCGVHAYCCPYTSKKLISIASPIGFWSSCFGYYRPAGRSVVHWSEGVALLGDHGTELLKASLEQLTRSVRSATIILITIFDIVLQKLFLPFFFVFSKWKEDKIWEMHICLMVT